MRGQHYDLIGKKVYVAGHRGMVGGAIARRLASEGCDVLVAGRDALDLIDQGSVDRWFRANRPQAVFLAAARVGGIHANNVMRADFLYDNLMIAANVIKAAHETDVEKLMFLGSSCIYPKHAPQPMREDVLLTSPLEPTNEPYAIAKIAGLKLAESYRRQHGRDFISVMPTNIYGPGDNYHPENSHVAAALIRRFHEAKIGHRPEEIVWGTGTPKREFLYVDDLADACVHLMRVYSDDLHVNIGTGEEIPIGEFAQLVAKVVGYEGRLVFDTTKPDGTPLKRLDVSRLASLGWRFKTGLEDGLTRAYASFLESLASGPRER